MSIIFNGEWDGSVVVFEPKFSTQVSNVFRRDAVISFKNVWASQNVFIIKEKYHKNKLLIT